MTTGPGAACVSVNPDRSDFVEHDGAGADLSTATVRRVTDTPTIRLVHILRTGEPKCPKCGQGLESEGGSVVPAGSWDWGPLYWCCEDDGEEWGYA